LGRLSAAWSADTYAHWGGATKRDVGFQAGCCLLVRRLLLEQLHGFDETLFHQFEDADLCLRIQQHGHTVRYFPDAEVIHLGGRNRGRYPLPVVLETYRSRYRFFLKHYGETGANQIRWVTLIGLGLRRLGYGLRQSLRPTATQAERLKTYRILFRWHWKIDPVAFVTSGREPDVGVSPLRPARVDAASACSK
jgi:GT2 family glycosyltransferase